MSGDSYTQRDGTVLTPSQSLWYDANGWLRCYSKGTGTSVLSYDALGRMTSVADPDDSSANATSLCAKSSGRSGWNTQTTMTYFADGSQQSHQTPAQRQFGVSSTFTYDADGNLRTQTDHHGCIAQQPCPGGVTTKWYDGADRLVEVAQPTDASANAWNLRYLYDLSRAGGVLMTGSPSRFAAYGNLYKTQTYVAGVWTDQRGSQFDGLDREVRKYSYSITATGDSTAALETAQLLYDADAATLGLLKSKTNPNGESVSYDYDALARIAKATYAGEAGLTPAETYSYDANGREVAITSSVYGAQQYAYDADGRMTQSIEPSGGGLTGAAQLSYAFYPDGRKAALSVSSASLNQSNAISYSYRADGPLQTQTLGAYGGGVWNKTYTDAGRPLGVSGAAVQSYSYDTSGEMLTQGVRGGVALSFTHDPEASVLTSAEPSLTLTNTLNVRGDLIEDQWSPNPYSLLPHRRGASNAGYVNIAAIPLPTDSNPDPAPCSDAADLVNGVRVELGCPSPAVIYNNQSYPQGSDNRFSFDASGRAVTQLESQNTWVSTQGPPPRNFSTNKNTNKSTTTTSTYDAENHLANFHPVIVKTTTNADTGVVQTITTDHGTTTVGWGPNGHPVSVQNLWMSVDVPAPPMTLHWDGDALLYITNASGTVINFKVGLDGDVNPTDSAFAGLVAYDRDRSGTVIQCNSTAGNSGFINPADANPNGIACTTQPGGFTAPVMTYLPYVRSDGFAGLPVQINGVRAYDPKLGNWTTPDAYEGDVHDPGSQQRYMWNRNNPYEYSDPTGYDAIVHVEGNIVTIRLPVTFEGGTDRQRSTIVRSIERQWSGRFGNYTVKTTVTEGTMNTIAVRGDGPTNVTIGEHGTMDHMNMGMNQSREAVTYGAAHEGGHLLGLPDEYTKVLNDKGDMVGNIVHRGYEKNVMGSWGQTQVKPSQIEQIINSPQNTRE